MKASRKKIRANEDLIVVDGLKNNLNVLILGMNCIVEVKGDAAAVLRILVDRPRAKKKMLRVELSQELTSVSKKFRASPKKDETLKELLASLAKLNLVQTS
jgi:hypothetical protein